MPLYFTQIERETSHRILWAFFALGVVYVLFVFITGALLVNVGYIHIVMSLSKDAVPAWRWPSVWEGLLFSVLGVLAAWIHWSISTHNLTERLIKTFKARPPDPTVDREHMFMNIIEEVRAALGGVPIKGMILPLPTLNACAFGEEGRIPVIAVTEGLLLRLPRQALEAVVAHEAGHIARGDVYETTSIIALAGVMTAVLENFDLILWNGIAGSSSDHKNVRHKTQWKGVLYLVFLMIVIRLVLYVLHLIAFWLQGVLSRQREFRADAVAVRLTRDPFALAQALFIIMRRSPRLFGGANAYASLFIVSPKAVSHSLFSFDTHPPITQRIQILLEMSRRSQDDLEQSFQQLLAEGHREALDRLRRFIQKRADLGMWSYRNRQGQWIGPMRLEEILMRGDIDSNTTVRLESQNKIIRLSSLPEVWESWQAELMREQIKEELLFRCPGCGGRLASHEYEKETILKCTQCQGVLLDADQMGSIFYRRAATFDSATWEAAQRYLAMTPLPAKALAFDRSDRVGRCERCLDKPRVWRRGYFNQLYPVEVDRCCSCDRIFLDKGEIELLQAMYELRDKGLS